MRRLIKEIALKKNNSIWFQTVAIDVIHETDEAMLISFFESNENKINILINKADDITVCNLAAIHAKRVTIQMKNVEFIKSLTKPKRELNNKILMIRIEKTNRLIEFIPSAGFW